MIWSFIMPIQKPVGWKRYVTIFLHRKATLFSGVEAGTPVRAVSWQTIDNHLLIFFAADNEENVHGVMHLYSVNPVQILFLLCDFHKKYILCVLKLAAVSASHCTLVIKAILTNLFTKNSLHL